MLKNFRNKLTLNKKTNRLGKLQTPGVYVEEILPHTSSVAQVETAVPGFIGYTEKARLQADDDLRLTPTRIRNLLEYEQFFGGPANELNISVGIKSGSAAADDKVFADLGQRRNYLMYYALQLFFANGGGTCYITSVGSYDNADLIDSSLLQAGLEAVAKQDEVTLIVFPEGQNLSTAADYHSLQQASLAQCAILSDRFAVMDLYPSTTSGVSDIDLFRNGIGTNNLKYGAAYYPNLDTVFNFMYQADQVSVQINGAPAGSLSELETNNPLQFAHALSAINQLPNTLPPSSAIVGIYTAVDASRGVWKAPANVSINAVIKPSLMLSDADQENFNIDPVAGKSINLIRQFTGRGVLVWGARTLAGNDNEWRYVSVRRFFIMVEESIRQATARFAFETNDANSWITVKAMIENYLTGLWRSGALAGATPEQAFFVKVGLGATMTAQDILEERMIVEIGMAVTRPAEFIILRITVNMTQS